MAAAATACARVPRGDVGFEGDPSAEDRRDVGAGTPVGIGAGADTGTSCAMVGSSVDEIMP